MVRVLIWSRVGDFFKKKYHHYVNHISGSSKSNKDVKNLPIFNKNIPKQLDLLKIYYKISF
jgi:hypothetical protein